MLPRGLLREYSRLLSAVIRGMDMIAVFVAGIGAYFIRFDSWHLFSSYWAALLLGMMMTPLVFSFCNVYTSLRTQGFVKHSTYLIQGIGVLGLLLSGLSFFTKSGDIFSRAWFIEWMISALMLLILVRWGLLLLLRFMRSYGLNERQVVIVGANELGMRFANTVQQAMWTGFHIKAFIDDQVKDSSATLCGIPVVQTPQEMSRYLSENHIDELWIALPLREEMRVKAILHELRHHMITTRYVLDIFGLDLLNHVISDVAGFPVLDIHTTPMVGMNRLIKAMEDRVLAMLIVLFVSPLLILLAIGVKVSSRGPVFFKQQRLGWDGRIIKIYKFRTMIQHQEAAGVLSQATISDQRVTTFGRFLRRTSLDELPQFINVLQGRMSIVGPRPHALAHNELYKNSIHAYMHRHRVKPGITGWAQVNGWRGETDTLSKMEKRVEYDLFYINNWSLGFDLKIIFLTFFRGFIHPNAY